MELKAGLKTGKLIYVSFGKCFLEDNCKPIVEIVNLNKKIEVIKFDGNNLEKDILLDIVQLLPILPDLTQV
eukprot:snap_masked-scaffold_10-processed-gene-7.6-mRNA-1 protein AED:1.00 eAED:1.00 QI:0/0/0/0/1/1/3/0/70